MKRGFSRALKRGLQALGLADPLRKTALRLIEWKLRRGNWQSDSALQKLLNRFSELYPGARFIQIGANDGELADPLRRHILKHGWRGILVEPMPHIFAQLQRNYAGVTGLIFEPVAISEVDGTRPIYRIAPGAYASNLALLDALTSLSRESLQVHAGNIPDLDRHIVEEQIQSLTFDSLCRKHGVQTLHLLAIDTEGYDYEILKTIRLAEYQPSVIIYEHVFLDDSARAECRRLLDTSGYECLEGDMDTLCVRRPKHSSESAQAQLHDFFLSLAPRPQPSRA